jgi:hypothetical protein
MVGRSSQIRRGQATGTETRSVLESGSLASATPSAAKASCWSSVSASQRRGQAVQVRTVLGEELDHLLVGVVDQVAHLLVDESLRRVGGLARAGQEEIGFRPGRDGVVDEFLGHAATERHLDPGQQILTLVGDPIVVGHRKRHTERPSARNDRDLADRIGPGREHADECVAGLVKRCPLAIDRRENDAATAAQEDLLQRVGEIPPLRRGDREERRMGLAGHRPGQTRLARPRRSGELRGLTREQHKQPDQRQSWPEAEQQ